MSVAEIFDDLGYGPAPESDKEAVAWITGKAAGTKLYIGGKWQEPADGGRFECFNPATGEVLASIAQGGEADIDAAVAAARKAQRPWAELPGFERAKYLYALARAIQRHSRLFAVLEAMDNGKSMRETRDLDIPFAARHFYHHAGWAELMTREFPDRVPVGVCGQIIPWNFPLLMLSWKIAPAIALGNATVLKPAEFTPLSALLFGEICDGVGLPPGVVNIVTGDGATGAFLVDHQDNKIAFTGSTEVGRRIRQVTAGTGK